jgi:hypothetical protein
MPEETVNLIVNEVAHFSEGAPQSDDITVMAVKYLGMESEKWKVKSEKWKVKSGKWKVESEE